MVLRRILRQITGRHRRCPEGFAPPSPREQLSLGTCAPVLYHRRRIPPRAVDRPCSARPRRSIHRSGFVHSDYAAVAPARAVGDEAQYHTVTPSGRTSSMALLSLAISVPPPMRHPTNWLRHRAPLSDISRGAVSIRLGLVPLDASGPGAVTPGPGMRWTQAVAIRLRRNCTISCPAAYASRRSMPAV
jgi:hypothetical protein